MAELHIVYEPNGFTVERPIEDPETGQPMMDEFGRPIMEKVNITQEMLDNLMPSVRVDISKENSFNILARDKWLDDLVANNLIDLKTRVRMASEGSPIPKNEMLAEIDRMQREQAAQAAMMQPPPQPQETPMA